MSEFDGTGAPAADSGPFQPGTTPTDLSSAPQSDKPTPRDFSDDDLVRIPGQAEPVKYGDLYKRLQADHTRKTQEAARAKAAVDAERSQWQSERQKQESELRQISAALLAQKAQPAAQDPFAGLDQLQALDGPTAAKLFNHIRENGFGVVAKAIQERDQVIQALHNEMKSLRDTVTGLSGQQGSQRFESFIAKTVADAGLPPEAKEFAKVVYLAHEGPNLDAEFPEILQNFWNQQQSVIQAQQRAKVDAAKKAQGMFPGRGGQGVASKLAGGLKGHESAAEITNRLWESMQAGSAT